MSQTITLANGRQMRLPNLPELKTLDLRAHGQEAPAASRPPSNTSEPPDRELWARLEGMSLDDPNAKLAISGKLAAEHNWTFEETARAIEEYKRFLYLAVRAGHPVTPSRPVDLVWHEHLLHTRHYWNVMCGEVLRQSFHHDPGDGSETDGERLQEQYRRTLNSYRTAFGEDPPTDIWPRPEFPARETPQSKAGQALCSVGLFSGVAGVVTQSTVVIVIGIAMFIAGLLCLMAQATAGNRNTLVPTGGCGAGCGGGGIGSTGCGDAGGGSGDGGSGDGGGGCGGGGD